MTTPPTPPPAMIVAAERPRPASPRLAATDDQITSAGLSLQWVCRSILTSPTQALRWLHQPTRIGEQPEAVVRVLQAEAALRAGLGEQAQQAATAAVHTPGIGPDILLAASAVLADVACWNRDPAAAELCRDYQQTAEAFTDHDRALSAAALHAVAVYQQAGCGHGRHLLRQAGRAARQHGADALAASIPAALTVTAEGCTRGYELDRAGWAPTPGGLLCPARTPRAAFLTSRLRRHPGTHTCRHPHPAGPNALSADHTDKAPR